MSRHKMKNELKNYNLSTMNYLGLLFALLTIFACEKEDPGDEQGAKYLELTIQ